MNSGDYSVFAYARPERPSGPLIVVSNRGPFEHYRDEDGAPGAAPNRRRRGDALSSLFAHHDLTWIVGAVSETDRELVSQAFDSTSRWTTATACASRPPARTPTISSIARSATRSSGSSSTPSGICLEDDPNLQQGIVDSWEDGYLPVNAPSPTPSTRRSSAASGAPASCSTTIISTWRRCSSASAIPTCCCSTSRTSPGPGPMPGGRCRQPSSTRICEGMLANDSVAFQTEESKRNFALTCLAYLPGVTVDLAETAIRYRGRSVSDLRQPDLRRRVRPAATARLAGGRRLPASAGRATADMKTIVRVDRLDPAKNVVGGFQAFDLLLERHPEWAGRVRFLAFLVPSREAIPEYRRYRDEVFALVDEINRRHGNGRWRPITVFYEENRPQALRRPQPLRRASRQLHRRRHEPRRQGGADPEPARRRRRPFDAAAGAYRELAGAALAVEAEDVEGRRRRCSGRCSMDADERRRARAGDAPDHRPPRHQPLAGGADGGVPRSRAARPLAAASLSLSGRPLAEEPPALIAGGIP